MAVPSGFFYTVSGPASSLLTPDDISTPAKGLDYEMGGVAIGDSSLGMKVAKWRARVFHDTVLIGKEPYSDPEIPLFSDDGITEVSLAFDQNMRPTVAYVANGVAKLRWFDTTIGSTVTTNMESAVRSPRLTLDDKRPDFNSFNDILFFYMKDTTVYYRQQRDRYNIEREVLVVPTPGWSIARVGMNNKLRMQVELERPRS